MKKLARRDALLAGLFGAGMVGLRSIASGLPAALVANPRKALADVPADGCNDLSKAQYVIFSTSAQGDPINTNAPGTYLDSKIVHPTDPSMAPTTLSLANGTFEAAAPWATLGATLQRTTFFHMMTNTPIHPKEHDVLGLMGQATNVDMSSEMFPSLLAKQLAPCLGTLQPQPVSVGGSPGETITFGGAALPIIPPTALAATLASQQGALGQLHTLRDSTLDSMMPIYKNGASPAQKQYIDALVTSQQQMLGIQQNLLTAITGLKDNTIASQLTAAIALIQMKVSPVIAIHLPFGADNHTDANLANETAQTVSGLASLVSLFQQLATAGLQDQVSFLSLNVFGRTMGPATTIGRNHNGNHQLSLAVGKPFKGMVVGGVGPVGGDYGCTDLDSSTGASKAGADVKAIDTMTSFAKSVMTALGGDPATIDKQITGGSVVTGMLA
ncbi:MAG TPA: hypothetical protein VGH28_25425 [Polyangiaceae bacterium]|jgi:hypothetical protein